jgi:hypothetical protein
MSTYSPLKIELIDTGTQAGTWGVTTNTNLGTALEEAITGSADVSFSSADVTLTLTNTNASQTGRNLRLNLTGTSGGARNLILGSGMQIEKLYLINNGLADAVTVQNTTGTGITVPAGKSMFVFNDGTNVVDAVTHLTSLTLGSALPVASGGTGATSDSAARTNLGATTVGSNFFTLTNPSAVRFPRINADNTVSSLTDSEFRTAIGAGTGAGSVTSVATGAGLTGGPITTTGTVSVATNGITDTLLRQSAAYAVVGRSASTTGDVADIAAGSDHQVLRRSGTSLGFGAVALNQANAITGTLGVANGGTGATTLTAENVILGDGTNAVKFVAPGTSGNVLTSNGSTWTSTAPAATGALPVGALQYFAGTSTATYPGSEWLRCDGSIVLQATYSTLFSRLGRIQDLPAWTTRVTATGTTIRALTYSGTLYVNAGNDGVLATSTNAITWTARTSGTASVINALTYGDNLYVYAGDGGALATSTNAITWTARTSGTSSTIFTLTYGDNLYVYGGAGGVLATSTDAITWTARTSGTSSTIRALTYGDNLYVYAGNGGVLATSTDAITWTARTSGTSSTIFTLTYGNNLYVYAGNGGVLATSTDAITWTARTSGTTSIIRALIYGNNLYVYAGDGGALRTSSNAITWTASTSNTTSVINALIYGTVYVFGGFNGLIRTSSQFSYNTDTEFALPETVVSTIASLFPSNDRLYIKATA